MSGYQYKVVAVGLPIIDVGPTNYEPIPRMHGDKLMHHGHRFPIKGGISRIEAQIRNRTLRLKELINENLYSESA